MRSSAARWPDQAAAEALGTIVRGSSLPLIADIHFDYRLALAAVESGVAGLRLNPGNIGETWKVAEVVSACRERQLPIRIGVNAGSLEPELLRKYGHPTSEAMVESALGHIRILEELNYEQIKVSLKASDIARTVDAYRLLAKQLRLSAAYRYYRGGHDLERHDQECHRPGDAAL